MAARRNLVFLCLASVAACGLTVEEHGQVDRWLLCTECVDGELDTVLALHNKAVGRLSLGLLEGPTPGRISMMELKYRQSYQMVVSRMGPNPLGFSEAQYVDHYLNNYVATYRSRSAIALGRIANPQAIGALREALPQAGLPPTVIDVILEALSSIINATGGDNQTAVVATTLTDSLGVTVEDQYGATVANVPVIFAVLSGNGVLFGTSPRTDAQGRAYARWTLGPVPETQTVRVTAGDTALVFNALATATVAIDTVITPFDGLAQRAPAGTAVPTAPIALVTNGSGIPVTGVPVTFSVLSGGGSVPGPPVSTDVSGLAAPTSWTLGLGVGVENRLVSTIPSATPSEQDSAYFVATTTGPRADSLAISTGDNQTAAAGTVVPVPPAVVALDASGTAMAGVAVSFFPFQGGGTVTGTIKTTDANGVAAVDSWTLGAADSVNLMRATAVSVTPVTFRAAATFPLAVVTSLPTSSVGLEVVRLTAPAGFLLDRRATVSFPGSGISTQAVRVDPGGGWIEYVQEASTTGIPTISGVVSASAPNFRSTLLASTPVTVSASTLDGTTSPATAPPIPIPAPGNTLVFHDGGTFGGAFPGGLAARLFSFTLSAPRDLDITLTWQRSLVEDLGVYMMDNPPTAIVCAIDDFGSQAGGPESGTCPLAAGSYLLAVVTAGASADVYTVQITTQ